MAMHELYYFDPYDVSVLESTSVALYACVQKSTTLASWTPIPPVFLKSTPNHKKTFSRCTV